jgi:hypothetical protein
MPIQVLIFPQQTVCTQISDELSKSMAHEMKLLFDNSRLIELIVALIKFSRNFTITTLLDVIV